MYKFTVNDLLIEISLLYWSANGYKYGAAYFLGELEIYILTLMVILGGFFS